MGQCLMDHHLMDHGSWIIVHGSWIIVHGSRGLYDWEVVEIDSHELGSSRVQRGRGMLCQQLPCYKQARDAVPD
jgi:hypothetical protein